MITNHQALDESPKSCPAALASSSPRLQVHSPVQQLIASQTNDNIQRPPTFSSSSSPLVATEQADARPSTPSIHILHQQQPLSIYAQPHISPGMSSNQQELQLGPPQNHDLFQTLPARTPNLPPRLICQYPGQVSSPGRKQRFTMGPRADCLKCRMNVKGHWMHFD